MRRLRIQDCDVDDDDDVCLTIGVVRCMMKERGEESDLVGPFSLCPTYPKISSSISFLCVTNMHAT